VPTPSPQEKVAAELDAFREQWRVVRRESKALVAEAEAYPGVGGERAYKELFANTYREVNALMGMAIRLSPLAREAVEAGTKCPLFLEDGALSPWWRALWLDSPVVQEVARIRRMKARA